MKRTVLVVALALLSAFAFAQQQPVVAVAPFDIISGVSAADAAMITDVFFVRLGNTRKVSLVNRAVVQRVIKEHNFQLEDWSNKDKTAALGEALNADWIVQGDIRKLNNGILVIVQFYDIRTFRFEGGTDLRLANADEAYDKMDPLVDSLIQTIGGTGTGGNTGSNTPPPPPAVQVYKIGDTGPAGGIIFYDKGFTGDGWRYLEAAPAGAKFTAEWGAYKNDVPGTMTSAGFGRRNTQIIADRLRALRESNKAAQICAALDINGYKDWFLPSRDELDLMYKNLKQKGLGGFSDGWYWSSSQLSGNRDAWGQRFSDGSQSSYNKDITLSVRAVRAF